MNEVVVTSASFFVMRLIAQQQERKRKQPRKRRWWVTTVFKSRKTYSGSNLIDDLWVENLYFKAFCPMFASDFESLISEPPVATDLPGSIIF